MLWLKFVSQWLARAAVLMFAVFLLLPLVVSPASPMFLFVIPILAWTLTELTGLQAAMTQNLFPASNREAAWLPLIVWGLLGVTGLGAILLAQIITLPWNILHTRDVAGYWVQAMPVLLTGLTPALVLRRMKGWGRMPSAVFGFSMMMQSVFNGRDETMIQIIRTCSDWWPLWATACVFLVLEAPSCIGVRRVQVSVNQWEDPRHAGFLTCLADTLSRIAMLALAIGSCATFYVNAWQVSRSVPHGGRVLTVSLLPGVILFLGFLPATTFRWWRSNRASGMSRFRAFAVLLAEMTQVGCGFRSWLGVLPGTPVRCEACGDWRMTWQETCPHCHDTDRQLQTRCSPTASATTPESWSTRDPLAYFFRVKAPLIIIVIIGYQWWPR